MQHAKHDSHEQQSQKQIYLLYEVVKIHLGKSKYIKEVLYVYHQIFYIPNSVFEGGFEQFKIVGHNEYLGLGFREKRSRKNCQGRVVVEIHVALVEIFVALLYINLFMLCMTRSNPGNFHAYDLKIDMTFHSSFVSNYASSACASDPSNSVDSDFDLGNFGFGSGSGFDSNFGVGIFQFSLDNMDNNDRSLKKLATLDSGLMHLLPKFHGLAGEDPYKNLKESHVVCSTMRPYEIPEDYIKMKAFPFSVDGAAKDWLYLQPILFNK
ncbi:hypothetical protein CR513_18213, partial [Mucuna pruriens]